MITITTNRGPRAEKVRLQLEIKDIKSDMVKVSGYEIDKNGRKIGYDQIATLSVGDTVTINKDILIHGEQA